MTTTNMEFILDNDFGVGKNQKEDSFEVYIVNDDITVALEKAKVEEAATAAKRDPFYVVTLIATICEKQVVLGRELEDSPKEDEGSEEYKDASLREVIDFAISIMNITPEYPIRSLITLIEDIKGYELNQLLKGKREIKEFFPGIPE